SGSPAKVRVPPLDGYDSPGTLPVDIHGSTCDVLAFDPRAARQLWASAAPSPAHLPIPIHFSARVDGYLLAEILRFQWKTYLGIEARIIPVDSSIYGETNMLRGDFTGVSEDTYCANYSDPMDPLSVYQYNYANWSDPEFDRVLAEAATTI